MVAQKNRLAEAAFPNDHNTRRGIASVLVNVKGALKRAVSIRQLSRVSSVFVLYAQSEKQQKN